MNETKRCEERENNPVELNLLFTLLTLKFGITALIFDKDPFEFVN